MTDDQKLKLADILTRLNKCQPIATDSKDLVELIEDIRATAYDFGFKAGATYGY